jgi:hypothetical protein
MKPSDISFQKGILSLIVATSASDNTYDDPEEEGLGPLLIGAGLLSSSSSMRVLAFADSSNRSVSTSTTGRPVQYQFNFGKNLASCIMLQSSICFITITGPPAP